MLEYDTENLNSDEIYSSLRGVTEAIQSFRYRSEEDLNEPIRREFKKDDGVGVVGSLCMTALFCMKLWSGLWIIIIIIIIGVLLK